MEDDGRVGPATRAMMDGAPATPATKPEAWAWAAGLPREASGLWIHRLDKAIERAGGTVEALAEDVITLGKTVVWVKVCDGRSLHNQASLGPAVDAFRAAGVLVGFWGWVYAIYYDVAARPESPYHATVEYVCAQAEVLADQCRRHSVKLACANMEGEGAWSTSSSASAVFGPRNIKLFGSQAAADQAIAERAEAYAQSLEAELPDSVRVCSTHGLPWTQRLPWRAMCAGFHILAPQLYNPGAEGFGKRVPKACDRWRELGARRIRASGPSWRTKSSSTQPGWIPQLVAALHSGCAGANVDPSADWWTYELATDEQRALLQRLGS